MPSEKPSRRFVAAPVALTMRSLKSLEKLLDQDKSRKRSQACLNSLLGLGKRYVLQEPKKYSPSGKGNRRKSTVSGSSRFFQLRKQVGEPLEKLQDYYERTMATIDFPTVVNVNTNRK